MVGPLLLRLKPDDKGWVLLVSLDDLFFDWSSLTTRSQNWDDWAVLFGWEAADELAAFWPGLTANGKRDEPALLDSAKNQW